MVSINKPLPRFGLGMAALGRPGYINLNRSSVFDNKPSSTTTEEPNDANPTIKAGGVDVVAERSIERMQNQANIVMKTLVEESKLNNDDITPWFDCARSYGLSEKFVGEFLKENNIATDDVYVSSKWGYTYVADWKVALKEGQPHEIKDHSVGVS